MARIKIENLPEDYKITKEEMSKVMGGILLSSYPGRLYSAMVQGPTFFGFPQPEGGGGTGIPLKGV